MKGAKWQPWFKHGIPSAIAPGTAVSVGAVLGSLTTVVALLPFKGDGTDVVLLAFGLSLGALSGYLLWLASDELRVDTLYKITRWIAVPTILVLLLAIPGFFRTMIRSHGPHIIVVLLGGIFAAVLFAVSMAWGLVHLVGFLMFPPPIVHKPKTVRPSEGVWDRDLDR